MALFHDFPGLEILTFELGDFPGHFRLCMNPSSSDR